MDKKMTSKLGDVSAITITSPDLDISLKYYQKLGFVEIARNSFPFPWLQISDGAVLIMLRLDKQPYCSLTYYVKNLDTVVGELESLGIIFIQKPADHDMIRRFVFQSPDSLNISLVTFVDGFKQPQGPTALTFSQNDFLDPAKYPNKVSGIFGEFAHPVIDLDRSIEFWSSLGFTSVSKYETPYPWAIVHDGVSIIGLHQTTSFDYPVITYFALDQKEKIEKLKLNGVTNYEDRGQGSIVLTTPEQQHINLFKIGM